MTEGGAMYQRLVNVPLWISEMDPMKQFHGVGFYFFYFTPPVLILWLTMVISGWKYVGKGKTLLHINHIFYFAIILSTALYFIPFLELSIKKQVNNLFPKGYSLIPIAVFF
jgi:hypothetical protein